MTLPILALTPSQANYSFTVAPDTIAVRLDGGRSRIRQNVANGTKMVTVGWLLDSLKYDYLWAFYSTILSNGALSFQINMIIDNAELQLYTAWFVPETLALTNIEAETYTVQAQLEVLPNARDASFDTSLVNLYGIYGSQTEWFIDAMDYVANVALPATSS